MALSYYFAENKLTTPDSYSVRTEYEVAQNEEVIADIHLRNPTVSLDTINLVIEGLTQVCSERLTNGEGVTLGNFIRLFPSLPGRYESPSDTVSSSTLEINASVATPFRNTIRDMVALQRVDSTPKVPVVTFIDASQNQLPELVSMIGSGLQFTKTDIEQGDFIVNSSNDAESRAALYATITGTKNIYSLPTLPAGGQVNNNEYFVEARVKYTPNGLLRSGRYSKPLRSTRTITTAELGNIITANIFYTSYDDASGQDGNEVSTATYSAPGDLYNFYIRCTPSNPGLATADTNLLVSLVTVDADGVVTVVDTSVEPSTATGRTITFAGISIAGENSVGNLTQLEIWLDHPEQLYNLINQYYSGLIFEKVALDDTANLP